MKRLWIIAWTLCTANFVSAASGKLELRIVEKNSSGPAELVPARVHLRDAKRNAIHAPGLPAFKDHFNCAGSVDLELASGKYSLTVERGPEYRSKTRSVEILAGKALRVRIEMERWIDMAKRGWWSGETHVHRPLKDVPLLMRSEDLHIAPVLTVWNRTNSWRRREVPTNLLREAEPTRLYHVMAIEDERQGGALFFLNAKAPVEMGDNGREYPSPVANMKKGLALGAWIDIEKPFWWDVPTWVATGEIDSIGIANNHMCRSSVYASEAWGRARDTKRLPPPRGNGYHSQEIYYRLLNCGLRIPPSAGSASGVLPNPVGYNRVYVHLDGDFGWGAWWKGLAQGRSFVTNGPMLFVEANGELPGSVFRSDAKPYDVRLAVEVDGNDALESVEIIRDGRLVERITGGELRKKHTPRSLRFERSGWFLVRAITELEHTFRFASTAPFYVEIGDDPRTIHRDDVDYFLRWIDERVAIIERDAKGELRDPNKLAEVLAPHRQAREFFKKLR